MKIQPQTRRTASLTGCCRTVERNGRLKHNLTIFRQRLRLVTIGALAIFGLLTDRAWGWERGNHAGDWSRGATIYVYVDPIPADAPAGTSDAVDEAIMEWNAAQAPFGGLTLVRAGATKDNADIHLKWGENLPQWGEVDHGKNADPGFAKATVQGTIECDDGLTARGITRILKHELGHAEGLDHSAKSALMKGDAYSSNPGHPPTAADLNSGNALTGPTDDDLAGKYALWATAPRTSSGSAISTNIFDERGWTILYNVSGLTGPGLTNPITEFTLDLSSAIAMNDFTVSELPAGWRADFFNGHVDQTTKGFADGESASPNLLVFSATNTSYGIYPGGSVQFGITSRLGPTRGRAFSNSSDHSSDEFSVFVPMPSTAGIPTVSEWGLIAMALLLLTVGTMFLLRRQRAVQEVTSGRKNDF